MPKKMKQRTKFEKCTEETRYEFNRKLKETTRKERTEWIMEATEETLPQITTNRNKREISEELKDLIDDRGKALLKGEIEKAKELNKEAVKQRKRERQIEQLESVKKN